MEDDISAADLDKLHLEAAEATLEKTRQTLDYVLQGEGFAALLSAGEALLDWARSELMWQPIETAPNAEGSMFEVRVDCTNGYRKWTVNHLLVLDENGIHPDFDQGWAVDQYEYWRPILDTEPGRLPEPLEAFAEALKRVRGE